MKVALHILARMLVFFHDIKMECITYKVKVKIFQKSIFFVHGVPKSKNFARHLCFSPFLKSVFEL